MGLACSPRVGEELALSDQPGCHPEERVLCRPRSPVCLLRPYTECSASEIWLRVRFRENFQP